jgi:selenocysteine lyase/cysteine desulfurase
MIPVKDYSFISTAQRYEIGGTANYPGAVGLAAALKLVEQIGQHEIESHIINLTDRLIAGIDRLGIDLITPRTKENRSGIVTFSIGSAEENVKLVTRLAEQKILVSVRYTSGVGGVRVSCHVYDSTEDIDRLLVAISEFTKK